MKKILILFVSAFFTFTGFSQDLIVTNEGDSLNCKITKIEPDKIHFTHNHNGELRETFLPVSSVKVYQQDYFDKPDIPLAKAQNRGNYPRVRLAAQGGWSYRIAKTPEGMSSLLEEYVKDLKSGYNLGADFSYFINEGIGLGFKYNYYKSNNHMDDVYIEYDDGTMDYGIMEDNIAINFYGPGFYTRSLSSNHNNALIAAISLGYISYKNEAVFITEDFTIEGSSFGMVLDLGYDIGISDDMAIGLQLSFTLGTLSKLEVDYGSHTETIELDPDNYENLSRIDLSIGLRFNK
jgi:hypothetical protein